MSRAPAPDFRLEGEDVVVIQDKRMQKRCHRTVGLRTGKRTRVTLSFDLITPKDYFDPANDEVLLLDLLDHVQQYVMEFHDVPGFQLASYRANRKQVV